MTLTRVVIAALLVALVVLPITISAKRLVASRVAVEAARTDLTQLQNEVARLLQLRGKREQVAERKPPEQDVIARVSGVLADAGIPSSRFGGLRPDADAALPGNAGRKEYRRQSVLITLNGFDAAEVGNFLSRWCATQPLWTPSRIELVRDRGGAGGGGESGGSRYTVTIVLSATYLAEKEAT